MSPRTSRPPTAPATAASFPSWPRFEEDEVEAAAAVLRSGRVNCWTGEECRAFEREYAAFLGVRHAVALTNGTVALELALRGLGIGPGDEVVVACRTFIASASCAVAVGARPVFAEVDRDSQNVTAATVAAALTPRTRAVVCVHLAGWPCDMDAIGALARERGIHVVEDCAQAHGATWRGRPVGSFGHVAAFSFCQDKILTTGGEGGLLATDDEALWERAWAYKDHGKSFDAACRRSHPPGFRWLHESWGTNWRLTEPQAAIGRIQLRKLPAWTERRRRNAAILRGRLAALPALRIPEPPPEAGHACYKFYAFVRPERLRAGWTRDRVIAEVAARGVPCLVGSCGEIYRERAVPASWRPPTPFPVAEELFATSLMLLVHPTLGDADMERMASVAAAVMDAATD